MLHFRHRMSPYTGQKLRGRVESAIVHVTATGEFLTADVGGHASTREVGDAVVRAINAT